VVAEGVENAHALAFATAHGCAYAQGFFFSEGKHPEALQHWLHTRDLHEPAFDASVARTESPQVAPSY